MSQAAVIMRTFESLVERSEFVPVGRWSRGRPHVTYGRQRAFGARRRYVETLIYLWEPVDDQLPGARPFMLTFRFDQTETLAEIVYNWTTFTGGWDRLLEVLGLPAVDLEAADVDGPLPVGGRVTTGPRPRMVYEGKLPRVRVTGSADTPVHLGEWSNQVPGSGTRVSVWRVLCGRSLKRAYPVKMSTAVTCAKCLEAVERRGP